MILLAIGAGAVILVILAIWLSRRQRFGQPPPAESKGGPAAGMPAERSQVDDFKTVKVYKTTKVLPGQLVVVDNGQESDVLYLSDQSGRGEIEIGRDSPDIAGGIRIKDPSNTVSRRQARIVFLADRRQFQLFNLAGENSNPTAVNGRALRENESVTLTDGDRIAMGGLTVKFAAK
jgi:hypothetical protein